MNEQVKLFLEEYPDLKPVTVERFAYTEDARKRDLFDSNSKHRIANACRTYDLIGGGNRDFGYTLINDGEFIERIHQGVREAIKASRHTFPVGLGAQLSLSPKNGPRLVFCPKDVYEPSIETLHNVTDTLKYKLFKPEAHQDVGLNQKKTDEIRAEIENSPRIKFRRDRANKIAEFVLQNRPGDLEERIARGEKVEIDLPQSLVDDLGLWYVPISNEEWGKLVEDVARNILDFRIGLGELINPQVLFVAKWWNPKQFRKDEDQKWIEETRLNIGIVRRTIWLDELFGEIKAALNSSDSFFDKLSCCCVTRNDLSGQGKILLYPRITEK